jgi:hypothetical protein
MLTQALLKVDGNDFPVRYAQFPGRSFFQMDARKAPLLYDIFVIPEIVRTAFAPAVENLVAVSACPFGIYVNAQSVHPQITLSKKNNAGRSSATITIKCNQLSAAPWQLVHLIRHTASTVPQRSHDQITFGT